VYLNGSSSHDGFTIVCLGTGVGIGVVGVSTVGATCVKCGDLGGGTIEASEMPDCTGMAECTGIFECTGMASGIAEPTRIVEDHTEMTKSS
jgi:hypothetical protein